MMREPVNIELLPLRISQAADQPHRRREILCKRPFREGGIRLEAENVGDKKVIHCYGHGGSGWTLGPGCGQRILNILLARLKQDWQSLANHDITIIGGGVIGLFAAYYLSRHKLGHPEDFGEVCIVAESFDDLTSNNAGGLFEPFSIGGDPDLELLVDSYEFYHAIALGHTSVPEFEEFDIELLAMFSKERDVMPTLVQLGYIPHGVAAKMKIGSHVHDLFLHQIFYMDVALLMKHLYNIVTRQGVRAIRGISIQDFGEIDDPVIINCTGLRARELTGDTRLRPVLGHLVRLQNQPRALLDIEHNLHITAQQQPALRDTLANFLIAVSPEAILSSFASYAQSADNILDIRFPVSWKGRVARLLDDFFEILHELRSKVENSAVIPDPHIDGLQRIRVFADQTQRNRFIDSLALIIRIAELGSSSVLYENAVQLYRSYLPHYSKRYIFLIEQEFPIDENSADTYSGLSYFMPMLHETLVRDANGKFRYASENTAEGDIYAGVAGGTTIEQEDLSLKSTREEFDRLVQRLYFLGFR